MEFISLAITNSSLDHTSSTHNREHMYHIDTFSVLSYVVTFQQVVKSLAIF